MRIFAGFLGRERQAIVGLSTTTIFSVFAGNFFGNFRDEASIIISGSPPKQWVTRTCPPVKFGDDIMSSGFYRASA